jgi:hypothetical protein
MALAAAMATKARLSIAAMNDFLDRCADLSLRD